MKRTIALLFIVSLAGSAAMAQTARKPARPARPAVAPALQMLNQRIPEVSFTDVPLESVITWLKEYTKANVIVRWDKLENNGIERDKVINVQTKNVTLSMVLWLILADAGGSDVKLAYKATTAGMLISTAEDLGQEVIVRVYDVTDLLINIPRFDNAPTIDVSQALQGAGGSGGGGGSVFTDSGDEGQDDNDQGATFAAPGSEELIQLIINTVEPDSWELNGGKGRIIAFRTSLVVSNTVLVHQKLGGYVTEEGAD